MVSRAHGPPPPERAEAVPGLALLASVLLKAGRPGARQPRARKFLTTGVVVQSHAPTSRNHRQTGSTPSGSKAVAVRRDR
jgi:hypothetical protein